MEHSHHTGLRKFSKLTCFAIIFLIFAGAMVNSTGSGLAVPDWPTSYGNWIFVPMVGGVFYEHGHRLIAQVIGILTIILAIWIKKKDSRKWMHVLGFLAVGMVVLQGVLGGLTVLFYLPTPISVAHGVLAQTFLVLAIIIAYKLSKECYDRVYTTIPDSTCSRLIKPTIIFALLIYTQLILGAVMRHTGSGLAIHDFPTIAGQWIPTFDKSMLLTINDWRFEYNLDKVNMTQVLFHLTHRAGALIIFFYLIYLNYRTFTAGKLSKRLKTTIKIIDVLIVIQILLGIWTVLSIKNPYIASLHVVMGAITLAMATIFVLRVLPVKLSEFIHHE